MTANHDGANLNQNNPAPSLILAVGGVLGLVGLIVVSRYNYLLFHGVAELFSITVAWSVFILAWNTRDMSEDDALVFVGVAFCFIGLIDLLHILSYKGMGVFEDKWGANLPTQLWILARYMQGFALLLFPLLFGKRIQPLYMIGGWAGVTAIGLGAIFIGKVFPDCYIQGSGLTRFKIISEYVICLVLGAAWVLLYSKRGRIEAMVFRLLAWAILTTMAAELAFTFYVSVYGLSNLVGHFFKIIAFYCIYLALVRSGLTRPYSILFRSLRESRQKYQNIFHNAQVGLFRARTSDGQPLEINERFAVLAGYPDARACLDDFDMNEDHAMRQIHADIRANFSNADVINNHELRIRKKEGKAGWISLAGRLDKTGDCWEGAIADISERKAQEALQASHLRLVDYAVDHTVIDLLQKFLDEAEMLTESQIGFFHFVKDDQETLSLQTWSTNTLQTICKAQGDGLHYPISEAGVWVDCVGEGRPVVHNDYNALAHKKGMPEGHAPVLRELVVPVLRGQKVMAILGVGNKATQYGDEDIQMVQTLADSAWEIVVRKRAEEKFQKAHQDLEQQVQQRTRELKTAAFEFESLFNSSQVGMMVLRGGRYLAKGNQRLADILGYAAPEEMQGLSMRALHLNETRFNEFGQKYYYCLTEGEVLQVEYQLKRKDGSLIWCSLSGKALDVNRPINLDKGVLWIIDDISERKRSELALRQTLNELERSNAELAQFAYVASHDLQEPLRAIVGFLQLFESKYSDKVDRKGRNYIQRTVNASHRMQTLITDLLALSRVNTHGSTFEETDLNNVFKQVKERLQVPIKEKKAQIRCAPLPSLAVDAGQISTLFMNLISNALKYNTDDHPTIEIGWCDRQDDICFNIKDNGIGIDPKFYERIFIVFQRLHGRREYSGTGVGLTLCKKIVERHGGAIWVESEPGRGTTFFFTLPKERKDK